MTAIREVADSADVGMWSPKDTCIEETKRAEKDSAGSVSQIRVVTELATEYLFDRNVDPSR